MWGLLIFGVAFVGAFLTLGIGGLLVVGVVGIAWMRISATEARLSALKTELQALVDEQRQKRTAAVREQLAPSASAEAPVAAATPIAPTPAPVAAQPAPPAPAPVEPIPVSGMAPATHITPATEARWQPAARPAWQHAIDSRLADLRTAGAGDIEQLVAGRGLAIAGGAALILGAIFFLGLAFSRGWIGPEMRVVIGLVGGAAIFALGAWLLRRERAIVAHVLVAVGLAVLSLSLFAATRLYGFVAPEVGVGAALAIAVATAALAIVSGSQLIAVFGLVAVLGSPPIMGASASLLTMLFLGAALVGTTAIAVFRGWFWLSPLAFLLAAPQLATYLLDTSEVGVAVSAIAAFWLVNVVAAGGAEWTRGGPHSTHGWVTSTAATLVVASGAFATWGGLQVLTGEWDDWRGLFLLGLAVSNALLASPFLARRGLTNPFGMVAAGSGIAVLTLSVPIQLGDAWVPMAWAAEAVALTLVYVRRDHLPAGISALILGALAVGHLVVVQYPLALFVTAPPDAIPFWNENGAALGVVLLALAVSAWLVRSATIRIPIATVGCLLLIAASAYELTRIPFAVFLGLLGVVVVLVERRVLQIRLLDEDVTTLDPVAIARGSLYVAAAAAAVNLAAIPLTDLATPRMFAEGLRGALQLPEVPFVTDAAVVIGIGVLSALVIAAAIDGRLWRQAGVLVAVLGVAYLLPTQVGPAWTVAGWVALAVCLHFAGLRFGLEWLRLAAPVVVAAAVAETLMVVAPPTRLFVRVTPFAGTMILNGALLALAAIAAAFALRGWLPPRDQLSRWSRLAAAVTLVYLLSVATVDVFQAQVGGSIRVEELQKQAQVALSVLWAVIGLAALVFGLARDYADARIGGLGLLGIVTVKVFVFDMAALDVAYRVLSFIALGVLLLIAAYLYRRMQHPPMAPHAPG